MSAHAYTIQDLERLVAMAGAGDRDEQECTQIRAVEECTPLPDFRVDIRRDIYNAVLHSDRAITRAQIAKAVKRKKSTWLVERIEACVADGLLTRSQTYWKNGVVMYYYSVAAR